MMTCDHNDVRYCPDEKGAIACFDCGRLFGHLRSDATFVAYNPPRSRHLGSYYTLEELGCAKEIWTEDAVKRSMKGEKGREMMDVGQGHSIRVWFDRHHKRWCWYAFSTKAGGRWNFGNSEADAWNRARDFLNGQLAT